MRIIDQSGTSDLPYEHVILAIDEGSIVAKTNDGKTYLMAQYSDIEKAKAALKKLWIDYQRAVECVKRDFKPHEYTGMASEYFRFPEENKL